MCVVIGKSPFYLQIYDTVTWALCGYAGLGGELKRKLVVHRVKSKPRSESEIKAIE